MGDKSRPLEIKFDLESRDKYVKQFQKRKQERRVVSMAIQKAAKARKLREQKKKEEELLLQNFKSLAEVRKEREEEWVKERVGLENHKEVEDFEDVEVTVKPMAKYDDKEESSDEEEFQKIMKKKFDRDVDLSAKKTYEDNDGFVDLSHLPSHLKTIYGVHKIGLDDEKLKKLLRKEKLRKKSKIEADKKGKLTSKMSKKNRRGHMKHLKQLKRKRSDGGKGTKRRKT